MDYAVIAVRGQYDVGILMSTDTDLKPALEFVASLTRSVGTPRAEVAAWSGNGQHNRRLSITGGTVYCHWVGEATYRAVADHVNYSVA